MKVTSFPLLSPETPPPCTSADLKITTATPCGPTTLDERAISTKHVLNLWERNENHTPCLNSAKAIGCIMVNIGTQDLVEVRPHLVRGLISQIVKIQFLVDLNMKKTPQLVELVKDSKEVEELMSLGPEKVLLKWMNFHLKKFFFSGPRHLQSIFK